jgi:hypothetical protein
MEETKEIRIVDYQTRAEEDTIEMLDRYDAKVSDWMEKDYGIVTWVEIPKENVADCETAVVEYEGRWYVTFD